MVLIIITKFNHWKQIGKQMYELLLMKITYCDGTSGEYTIFGSTISPRTNIPPPALSPFKQWENTFGVNPDAESCETTDIACCPNPKIPSTALSDFVKSPVCEVLQLFHNPPSKTDF